MLIYDYSLNPAGPPVDDINDTNNNNDNNNIMIKLSFHKTDSDRSRRRFTLPIRSTRSAGNGRPS